MASNPDALRDEGRRLFRDGSMAEAIEHLERALEGYTEGKQAVAAAEMMNDIGVVHRTEGRLDKAAQMLEKARAAFAKAGERNREAQTLGNLALLYKKQGNNDKARATYTEAADIFADVNDKDKEGEILISRGVLEFEMGKRLDGITSYEIGIKMIKKPTSAQKRLLTMLKFRKTLLGN